MSMRYTKLNITTSLSSTGLEIAAMEIIGQRGNNSPLTFTLVINPKYMVYARGLLKRMMADVRDNPFAPYVNLVVGPENTEHEWVLCDGEGHNVGSEGL